MIDLAEYLKIEKRNPWYSEKYTSEEDRQSDKDKIVEYNKALIEEYPFLLPRNRWNGEVSEDYDYSFTELDFMPNGWRIAFGEQMMREIKMALIEAQKENPEGGYEESQITTNYDSVKIIPYLEGFRIMEIKEKYGGLRFYCDSAPQSVHDIIHKYEEMSYNICIDCGKPAKWTTMCWISPFCDDCKVEYESKDEFYDTFKLLGDEYVL